MFGSLMGDLDDDPFFGNHMRSMRQMSTMMNSMFSDPFAMMGDMGMMPTMRHPAITNGSSRHRTAQNQLMPFGFPNVNSVLQNFMGSDHLGNSPNCHSFSSSTIMTMTSGPDGRPQVYQASSSTRSAPGGVRETKKTVSDSRTGTKKMAIGHHIGERAHIIEREHNFNSGEQEEREELINLDDDEAPEFNKEFEEKTRRAGATLSALGYHGGHGHPRHHQRQIMDSSRSRHRSSRSNLTSRGAQLALPAPSGSEGLRQERAKKRDYASDEERKQTKYLKPSEDDEDSQ